VIYALDCVYAVDIICCQLLLKELSDITFRVSSVSFRACDEGYLSLSQVVLNSVQERM